MYIAVPMRRSRPLRLLGLLFSAWFALNGATASLRDCPMHGAARSGSHAAVDSHEAHAAHAGHSMPAEQDQAPAPCDCATECCGAVPLQLAPLPTVTTPTVVAHATAAPRPPRAPAGAVRARLLPFANGPPASLRG